MKRNQLITRLRALNIAFDVNASDRQLKALLSKNTRLVKCQNGGSILVKNDKADGDGDDDPVTLMFCDDVGKDPWTGRGINVQDIQNALAQVTNRSRTLSFLTNSDGGLVSEGVAIRNFLNEWPGRIENTIIGRAASSASWCIPADHTRAYKSSQVFMHRNWGELYVVGNADDISEATESALDFLNTNDEQIAEMYADMTGKSADEMFDLMEKNTLLTGEEAYDLGLVDELVDGEPEETYESDHLKNRLAAMRGKLAALNKLREKISAPPTQGARNQAPPGPKTHNNKQQDSIVNRQNKIALLNQWGINCKDEAALTDARIDELINLGKDSALASWNKHQNAMHVTAPAPAPAQNAAPTLEQLQAKLTQLETLNEQARVNEVTAAIDQLVKDDKVTEAERKDALELALNKETGPKYLKTLNNRPPNRPGAQPVGTAAASELEITSEALNDITQFVAKNTFGFRDQFIGKNCDTYLREDEVGRKRIRQDMAARAKAAARAISKLTNKKHYDKIIAAWNTNNIDAGLQRQVIFTDFIEEFAIVLLPFETFSKVYSNVPLEGTDTIDVPFYPLSAAAGVSWNAANGYDDGDISDTTVNARQIQVGGSGNNSGANAPAGYAKDRKWIGLKFSSYQLRRQPYVNWEQHAKLQANALAVAIVKDVISRVITAANYGASIKAVPAAQFSADDVADLMGKANNANWPQSGRWMVLDSDYQVSLVKDQSFKQYLSYGSTDPVRKGLIKEAYSFENILFVPNLKNYSPAGENLIGWINHLFGVLLATAPIMPTEDVLQLLTRYDLIVHPQIDLVLEHRQFGDLVLDATKKIVECNYGAALGHGASLQRATSQ